MRWRDFFYIVSATWFVTAMGITVLFDLRNYNELGWVVVGLTGLSFALWVITFLSTYLSDRFDIKRRTKV